MESFQSRLVFLIYTVLVSVLEMLVQDFVQSGSIECVEEIPELLGLCGEGIVARSACTHKSDCKHGEGKDDEVDVLESRHHGSRTAFLSWIGLRSSVCWVGGG